MLRLEINNSTSTIHGLTVEQHRSLRQQLSYKVQGAFFSGDPTGGVRYLITKRGELATGLCARVIAWAKASKLPLQLDDQRKRPWRQPEALNATLDFKPYSTQTAAANKCRVEHRGIVQAPTGSGKSVMIALTIDSLKVKTLVVTPSLELKRQLTESLRATFGKTPHITVANVQSLDPKKPLKGYDCVIIDEYHHSAAKTYRDLNKYAWNDVYYRFGFTATPCRADDEEQALLESIIGEVIYTVPYAQAVKQGQIVPIEAYYVEVPKTAVRGMTWSAFYSEAVVNNEYRNKLIAQMLMNLTGAGKSTLVLVKEIKHGEILSRLSGIPFANGQDGESSKLIDQYNGSSNGGLIATTGVMGEGVDSRPCEYVIIAGLGKSRPAFMQQAGRSFRTFPGKESCKVIIIKDGSHKFSLSHYKEQVKILKQEYGAAVTKICPMLRES